MAALIKSGIKRRYNLEFEAGFSSVTAVLMNKPQAQEYEFAKANNDRSAYPITIIEIESRGVDLLFLEDKIFVPASARVEPFSVKRPSARDKSELANVTRRYISEVKSLLGVGVI